MQWINFEIYYICSIIMIEVRGFWNLYIFSLFLQDVKHFASVESGMQIKHDKFGGDNQNEYLTTQGRRMQ
jgi:hypothetical protein